MVISACKPTEAPPAAGWEGLRRREGAWPGPDRSAAFLSLRQAGPSPCTPGCGPRQWTRRDSLRCWGEHTPRCGQGWGPGVLSQCGGLNDSGHAFVLHFTFCVCDAQDSQKPYSTFLPQTPEPCGRPHPLPASQRQLLHAHPPRKETSPRGPGCGGRGGTFSQKKTSCSPHPTPSLSSSWGWGSPNPPTSSLTLHASPSPQTFQFPFLTGLGPYRQRKPKVSARTQLQPQRATVPDPRG